MLHCSVRGAPSLRLSVLASGISLFVSTLALAQKPADEVMQEVVVSASGFEQDIKQAPASISVITRSELQKGSFGSLTDALQSVEGVDVGAAAGKTGGLNISIRGMPPEYTLVLIDGRRQNAAGNVAPNGFGETQTSFMPPLSAIERIEVIRGPMSTLYGSDAMGGVINIITRKVGTSWAGSVSADYTLQQESAFGDIKSGNFYLTGPLVPDLLGLTLRGSAKHRDASNVQYTNVAGGLATPVMGANPVKSDVNNLGMRLAFTPNKFHDITLDIDSGRQKYDNSRGQLGSLTGGYTPEQRYNRDQWTLAHTGRYDFGTWDTSYMSNTTETIGRTIPDGPNKGQGRTLDVESRVLDSKLVMGLGNHFLTVGGQWWDAKMKDGVVSENFSFTQKALFVEDEWRIVENFGLTMGARYDRHSLFGGKVSPRVYGVWNATPQWTLKGGVSQGYKTPRVEQLASGINGYGGQGTIPLIGTPTLKPETSTATELGMYFDGGNGFSASATVFNNQFKDKITSGSPLPNCNYAPSPNRPGCVSFGGYTGDTFGQSVNVDKAVTRGLELAAGFPISATLRANANYTYTESEQKSGANMGRPLSDTPKHAVNARLNWTPAAAWSTWARMEYRSDRFRDPGTTATTIAAKNTLGDFKPYALFDIGGSYKATQQLTFNAAIYNLFNKNFIDYAAYRAANVTAWSYGNRFVNSMDGRRLWISANYEF